MAQVIVNFRYIILYILLCFTLTGCSLSNNMDTSSPVVEEETDTLQRADSVSESSEELSKDSESPSDESHEVVVGTLTNRGSGAGNLGGDTESGTLEVHYLDIGQGDAILIKQGDAAMLIDAGNNSKGTQVWSYLLSQGVERLDYAIGTHPDADHVGGLDVVLYKLDCDMVFLPDCEKDTKTYEELMQTIDTRGQQAVVPGLGQMYSLGAAEFQILTDTKKDYGDNTNDFSIAIRLTFGNNAFLFTGDAETEAEQDMLESGLPLKADVYKAAHHGADTANTEDFLAAVAPGYCVISCGQDNTYGHPRAGFLNNLRSMGVNVFRTDEQGTIVAVSDGETITFNASPSTSWKAGEPQGSGDSTKKVSEQDNNGSDRGTSGNHYILNTNSKKFHLPNCKSVDQIADKNKRESDKSREELIQDGYEPCKNCNP